MVKMAYHDERSSVQIIEQVQDGLENMRERIRIRLTLLDSAKHLIGNYCMTHISYKKDTPRELKLAIDLIDFIMSDNSNDSDMIVDYNNDLGKVTYRMTEDHKTEGNEEVPW